MQFCCRLVSDFRATRDNANGDHLEEVAAVASYGSGLEDQAVRKIRPERSGLHPGCVRGRNARQRQPSSRWSTMP